MMNKQINASAFHVAVYNNKMSWLEASIIVQAASGFMFTEGPAWHPDQFFLFSDTPANKLYRLQLNGDMDIYLDKSGWTDSSADQDQLSDQRGSNGIAVDSHENIFICQHGNHSIARLDKHKKLTSALNGYTGRPFNSPNDLIICSNGNIYFTDPPYGLSGQQLNTALFQPVAGIYQYSFLGLLLVGTELKYPNGLFLSRDEKYLYVSSNHPNDPGILRYSLPENAPPRYDGIFMEQHADGMTTDADGNIYLATDDGVLIVSATAEKLALVSLPETPSNLCWGGANDEILMVTARTSIYFIRKEINHRS